MRKKILGLILGCFLITSPVWAQNSLHDIPGEHTFRVYVPTVAAGTDKKYPLMIVPFNCAIVDVKTVYQAAVTGADTNTVTVKILNGGSAGSGTTLMASKAYTSGVNAVALSPESLTNTSTAADLNLSQDDVIVYLSDQAASGLADTEKIVEITVKAR